MADYLVTDTDLTSIASAIRTKGGTSAPLTFPGGFVDAVGAIPTGGITPTGTKQITLTDNGTITEDVTNYASAQITVAIPAYNGEIVTPAYNVTVSLTNPNYPSNFISCDIYKLTELGQDPGDVMISQISSPTGSATVSVNDGDMIGIAFDANYVTYSGVVTVSGGVSYLGAYGTAVQYYAFSVTGDGTITIDGMDYED